MSPEDRGLLSLKDFTGSVTYAGRHQGTECILADPKQAAGKVLTSCIGARLSATLAQDLLSSVLGACFPSSCLSFR